MYIYLSMYLRSRDKYMIVLLCWILSNFVKLCTFIQKHDINNEYSQSYVSICLHWQLSYFINVRNGTGIITPEFSIFNKLLLNLVISDLEVVHNFGAEQDLARFLLIIM